MAGRWQIQPTPRFEPDDLAMLHALAKEQGRTAHELFLGQLDMPGGELEVSYIMFDIQALMAWNQAQKEAQRNAR